MGHWGERETSVDKVPGTLLVLEKQKAATGHSVGGLEEGKM